MIDLYTWFTPNGHKVSIALEELALPYRVVPVNLGAGEQFAPEFQKISPNNKIPAIVDDEGPGGQPLALFESGAILTYLAEKAGALLPRDPAARYRALAWLHFQVGTVGPMLGQLGHFLLHPTVKIPYAIERYTAEAKRLFGALDRQLAQGEYVAGEYSIADIAIYPWLRSAAQQGVDLTDFPRVTAWLERVGARPAVKKGLAVPPRANVSR
jgi:GST-like protein